MLQTATNHRITSYVMLILENGSHVRYLERTLTRNGISVWGFTNVGVFGKVPGDINLKL